MAVLPIRITGDPVLHAPAEPVTRFDAELHRLVDDMFDTMAAAPGVGLAAPQVGVPLKLFVFSWRDDDEVQHRGVAANPELWQSPLSIDELDDDAESEGCLSIPGERFPLRRAERVLLWAQDADGAQWETTASGWLARIFQHETDHLEGVLYADRLEHPYSKDVAKAIRKRSWGSPGQSWLPGRDDLEA